MRNRINKYDRPRMFLDTVGRNSRKTRSNYETALVHLEGFLSNRYDSGKYNVDSIIDLISRNQMNVYELLDSFVSFECIKGSQSKNMPQSIKTHTAGIKSYIKKVKRH